MSKFTVGFIFSPDLSRVLLVHKEKPVWQKGKMNGIGGKIEFPESALACIARECEEESTLVIQAGDWLHFATLKQAMGDVEFFATVYKGEESDAVKNDYEEVEWFDAQNLPDNIIPNLAYLIPAAIGKLSGDNFEKIVLHT